VTKLALRVATTIALLSVLLSAAWRIVSANLNGGWWANASILHFGFATAALILVVVLVVYWMRQIWRD